MAITEYCDYLRHLESIYNQYGYTVSDKILQDFITNECLDVNFGVDVLDLRVDLTPIHIRARTQSTNTAQVKKELQDIEKKQNIADPVPIMSYENYERELIAFIGQNGDKSFLDTYVKKFIAAHDLDTRNPNLMSDIRMDLVFAQSKMPLSSATAQGFRRQTAKPTVSTQQHTTDNKFKSDVATIILNHKEVFTKNLSFKGLLWDYFPDRKREINVLMILANYGMLEDMRLEKTLGSVFISKYVTRIVNEYGIEKNFALEMALVWCYGYGEGLLGKKLIL